MHNESTQCNRTTVAALLRDRRISPESLLVVDLVHYTPSEAIRANLLPACQLVAAEAGEDDDPHEPVHCSHREKTEADDDMKPVRQCCVRTVGARGRRDKRCSDEKEVGDEEEDLSKRDGQFRGPGSSAFVLASTSSP